MKTPLTILRESKPGLFLLATLVVFAGSFLNIGDCATESGNKLEFNRDIRPILSETCYPCHGPDKNNRKAKLRLDIREIALEKEAIKPGNPDESELVRRIFATKDDDLMPPPESHKTLTSAQKELLKQWIAQGAQYQPLWAYIKPERPEIPGTKNPDWVKSPIDAFILHDLESRRIVPCPEADKRTLLRRLSLDLIGLPPTPVEVAAFLADTSPQAYERQVDRLLKSPHYGERMAVPWLDVVRFADTVGYHGDQNVNDFPYRDYVINSFNQNKPFDQFTIEQLAGDLLPNPATEQLVATGFNRLNMVTREGGAQPEEYLAKYGADRVRTVSTVWLGSTMGCCECHDHKFDPFSTKDFYSMKAFFADVKQWGVYADYKYTPNPDLKEWTNDHPFPPEMMVDSPYLEQQLAGLEAQLAELEKGFAKTREATVKSRREFREWRRTSEAFLKQNPNGWTILQANPTAIEASKGTNKMTGPEFRLEGGGLIFFTGKGTNDPEISFPVAAGRIAAIKLELIPREEYGGAIVRGKGESTTVKLAASMKPARDGKSQSLAFHRSEADFKEARYTNGFEVIGIKGGWMTSQQHEHSKQTAVWLLGKPLQASAGETLSIRLGKANVACVRVSVSPFAARKPLQAGGGEMLAHALSKSGASARALVNETYLLSAAPESSAFDDFKKLDEEILACRGGKSPTVVTVAWKPVKTRVLPRGNWQDETGEVVQPATPHFLPQPPHADGRRLTRLDLARWLVSRDNPLTARAVMNRTWKQFFGSPISAVVDDLGAQGEWPTHPELLDWLAVEFVESGWDIKHMVKLMVMSSTYRESAEPSRELHELDPANRLYASQSPRRLDAEFIRDNALAICGLLNEDIGGPSNHPYQPAGYYANLQFPDRDYHAETDERQYRRGVYCHRQRTFPQPMLANFDAPSREECVAARNVSNSPQQALTLLNDPTFVEAARVLAGKILARRARNDGDRLEMIYERALSRPIKTPEEESLMRLLQAQREYYHGHAGDAAKLLRVGNAVEPKNAPPAELAAWTQICRTVLGLHETITRY